jgi:hypothetical protein
MSLYKFESDDVLFNRIEANPRVKFVLHTGSVVYNDKVNEFGITNGDIALSELATLSASQDPGPYQFVTKDGSRIGWKTVSLSSFNSLQFGETLTSPLPMTASLAIDWFPTDSPRNEVDSLENTSNFYTPLSVHYAFSSALGDKATQEIRLFSVPSIFYGASLKKGTVDLKFYVTGTLIGRLQDLYRNGNLIQTEPSGSTGSGSVAGLVYYNEGFLMLTGSWDITTAHTEDYVGAGLEAPKWLYFGATGSAPTDTISSSYQIEMSGTQYAPVITMLAHADKADLNHSNNPTYLTYGQTVDTSNPYMVDTGSLGFYEKSDLKIKNVAKYMYNNDTGSFRKETYISKIGIYDDQKNLIGIAKVATPVRKRENDQFTFKLKMDI